MIILFILGSTCLGILGTWQMAGKRALVVVGMAWSSGFIILVSSLTLWGALLLFATLILGPIVCDNYKD
jgi:hypothetical protein